MFTHPTPVPSSLIPKGCPSSSTDLLHKWSLQRGYNMSSPGKGIHTHTRVNFPQLFDCRHVCSWSLISSAQYHQTGRSMKGYARTPCNRCYRESGLLFSAGGGGQNLLKILHTRMIAQKMGTCKAEWGKTGDCTSPRRNVERLKDAQVVNLD